MAFLASCRRRRLALHRCVFHYTVALQYGWERHLFPSHCTCRETFSSNHALSCPSTSTSLLKEVYHNVTSRLHQLFLPKSDRVKKKKTIMMLLSEFGDKKKSFLWKVVGILIVVCFVWQSVWLLTISWKRKIVPFSSRLLSYKDKVNYLLSYVTVILMVLTNTCWLLTGRGCLVLGSGPPKQAPF